MGGCVFVEKECKKEGKNKGLGLDKSVFLCILIDKFVGVALGPTLTKFHCKTSSLTPRETAEKERIMQRLIIAAILVASTLLGGCAGMQNMLGGGDSTWPVGRVVEVSTAPCPFQPGYLYQGPGRGWRQETCTGSTVVRAVYGSEQACRAKLETYGIVAGAAGAYVLTAGQKDRLAKAALGGAAGGLAGHYLLGEVLCKKDQVELILAGGGGRTTIKYYGGQPAVKDGVTCALRHNDRLVADFFDKEKNPEGIEIPSQGASEQCRAAIERVRKQAGI